MKQTFSFRNLFLVVAVISSLLLTACGGGGGGGNSNSGPSLNEAMFGTWYLNSEDEKIIVPNEKDEVDTLVFNPDGTFSLTTYNIQTNSNIWEAYGEPEKDSGTWEYKDGILYTTFDGEKSYVNANVDNDKLTIIEKDNETQEEIISVYKKTKNKKKEPSITGSYSSQGIVTNLRLNEVPGFSAGILIYSESDPTNYADVDIEKRTFKLYNLKSGSHYIVFKHIPNGSNGPAYFARSTNPVELTDNQSSKELTEVLQAKEGTISISGKITKSNGEPIVPAPTLSIWGQTIEVTQYTGEFTTFKMPEGTKADIKISGVNASIYQETPTPLVFEKNPAYYEIIAVEKTASNLPPTINLTSKNTNYSTDSKVTLTATAQDANNDELEFQWEIESCTAPYYSKRLEKAKESKNSSEYFWNAPTDDCLATISVKVIEKNTTQKLSATAKLKITIGTGKYINKTPDITSIQIPNSLQGNETYTISCNATDYEKDDLTYFLSITPNGGLLSKSSANTWTWKTPDINSATNYTLKFEVKDSKGNKAASNKKVTVQATPANEPLNIVSVSPTGTINVTSGEEVNLSVVASDPEDEKLTFTWYSTKGSMLSITNTKTTSNATWQAPYLNSNTTTTISCTIKDPEEESVTATFNIMITPVSN